MGTFVNFFWILLFFAEIICNCPKNHSTFAHGAMSKSIMSQLDRHNEGLQSFRFLRFHFSPGFSGCQEPREARFSTTGREGRCEARDGLRSSPTHKHHTNGVTNAFGRPGPPYGQTVTSVTPSDLRSGRFLHVVFRRHAAVCRHKPPSVGDRQLQLW